MAKLIYSDKPLFGFDIGRSSIKIMQVDSSQKNRAAVIGYGATTFNPSAIEKGVVVDYEEIAKAVKNLFDSKLIGNLTTKRVAFSIPNEYSFSRVLTLPNMSKNELHTAVYNEASRTIPVKNEDLYIDFEIGAGVDNDMNEIQLVATPKFIVDSLLNLSSILGIEVALVETNISAVSRIVTHAEGYDIVSLIIDLGSTAADLSIYDGTTVRITGTADCGSEKITSLIAQKLGVSRTQAHTIKTRYGIEPSKKQTEILACIGPELDRLTSEIKKIIRYYDQRMGDAEKIGQIIVLGGGANLPGLSAYITNQVRIATRLCDPWQNIHFGGLQSPHQLETTVYTTAAGLSLANIGGV
jgi:type IV pilus assembly protein PilM